MLKKNSMYRVFSLIILMYLSMSYFGYAQEKEGSPKRAEIKDIKAYCIDFNWGFGRRAGFAKPGMWKDAEPAEHVKWYKAIGANVIQTFAVSCNGYAWYKNGVVPEQPGLKHDFLTEVVKLGHAEGMKVMGYFCIGANTRWGKENPELSYGTPSSRHIPYTDEYLAYLSSAITDAVKTTGIDGFMIDWVWMPNRKATKNKWIDAEKKLYKQLMGEDFPGEDKITKEQNLAYGQKAIDRCWETIRKAAKDADPNCIIWLTTNNVNSPLVKDSKMYKEVDWFMGEKGKLEEILKAKALVGKHARLITCMSDFGGNNAETAVPDALEAGVGVYGYAKPGRKNRGGTIDLDPIFTKQLTQLTGNSKRIAVMARAYRGKSVDTVWKDGEFVEPEKPAPFKIELGRRSSRHRADTGRVDFEGDSALITIYTPYHKGRILLTRKGEKWPKKIVIRLRRNNGKKPMPYANDFRIANGEIGIVVSQREELKVIAGKMKEEPGLKSFWRTGFLNEGKPKEPIKIDPVKISVTDDAVEYVIPSVILESNPSKIRFEWGIDGKVF